MLIIKIRTIYTQQAYQSWCDEIAIKAKISYENREGMQVIKFTMFTWAQYLLKEMKNTTQEKVSIMIVSKQDTRKFQIRLEHYFTLIVTILSIWGYRILYRHSVWNEDANDRNHSIEMIRQSVVNRQIRRTRLNVERTIEDTRPMKAIWNDRNLIMKCTWRENSYINLRSSIHISSIKIYDNRLHVDLPSY